MTEELADAFAAIRADLVDELDEFISEERRARPLEAGGETVYAPVFVLERAEIPYAVAIKLADDPGEDERQTIRRRVEDAFAAHEVVTPEVEFDSEGYPSVEARVPALDDLAEKRQ